MTQTKKLIEVYIAMNEDGDFEVGGSEEEAVERFSGNCGGSMCRIIRKAFRMTPPAIVDLGEEDIPDEAGETAELEEVGFTEANAA